jgi:hypothetical protein
MSQPENFLERWSRRKREAADEAAQPPKSAEAQADKQQEKEPDAPSAPAGKPETPFDPARLPSLDSITAETDIRAFLQEGVPADIKREALRRAWSADPGIRDFVGLSENSWDFNDPNAMVGFGPIEPGEVTRLMAQFVMTPSPEEKEAAHRTAKVDPRDAPPAASDPAAEPRHAAEEPKANAAAQNESDRSPTAPEPDKPA